MSSTFGGISTALSSLYAQRRGLDVTGQNIANANTAGYTRQRVNLQAIGGSTIPAVFSRSDGIGQGVQVSSVTRTQDEFLETRGRTEHARDAYLTSQQTTMSQLEQTFNEPSDNGLSAQLGDFWGAWSDLANSPGGVGGGESAARSLVIEKGQTVVSTIHDQHQQLANLWDGVHDQLGSTLTDINSTAASVANLNAAIGRSTAAGTPANDLSDQRDVLVQHLSELTGASATTGKNGMVDVTVFGKPLVSGADSDSLSMTGAGTLASAGLGVTLKWSDGSTAVVKSGSVASSLETLNTTLTSYDSKLGDTANALISTVNTAHQAGYDLDGNAGGPFFTGSSAANVAVAISDPRKIAASDTPGGNLGDANANAIAKLAESSTGPDTSYQKLVVGLGVQSATTTTRAAAQTAVTQQVDNSRRSVSGVSLDEEMTNLIQYQRSYEAASKVLNSIDSTLQTLMTLGN